MPLTLHRRAQELHRQEAVRGRDRQSQPPHARRPRARGCARSWRKYQTAQPCEVCHGARLKPEALRGQDRRRGHLDVDAPRRSADALGVLPALDAAASQRPAAADRRAHPQGDHRAARLPQQCRARLSQPRSHLGHAVAAARASASASPARSAAGLSGVLYVLDEPSIGLHQRDNDRLLVTLQAAARSRQHRDRRRA